MAPDRGLLPKLALQRPGSSSSSSSSSSSTFSPPVPAMQPAADRRGSRRYAGPAATSTTAEGRSFTFRGVAVGLLIGVVLCFSNMYFGLQTGWISTMTMPASLLGYGFFKTLSRHLKYPFSPVENVLVQTVAASVGIVPLGAGFVGVIPALNYLMLPEEKGPFRMSILESIIWSLGLCYFGCLFAMLLRRQVIIREQLRFPSGFSTAVLIGVLHGKTTKRDAGSRRDSVSGGFASLSGQTESTHRNRSGPRPEAGTEADVRIGEEYARVGAEAAGEEDEADERDEEWSATPPADQEWKSNVRLLLICFCVSGVFTLLTYFIPILRSLPVFGSAAAGWLWTLNPSLAYVGQGIIMGPATTIHILLGAVVGWAILSPLAKHEGWAPGPIDDWETGSKGWIVWTSLSIMLADAVVSLGYVAFGTLAPYMQPRLPKGPTMASVTEMWRSRFGWQRQRRAEYSYTPVNSGEPRSGSEPEPGQRPAPTQQDLYQGRDQDRDRDIGSQVVPRSSVLEEDMVYEVKAEVEDAPPDQVISAAVVWAGFPLSMLFCVASIRVVFGSQIPLYAIVAAVLVAIPLSVIAVRAMGVTDLNPVSGISKLAQLFFAILVPRSNKAGVLINLVAGAVSESGALQAGDLMQDLKTGHLIGAAPKAQFWGQVIGATVGAVVSALVYKLYTTVYETIPNDLFQAPTALVWIFTARLVTSGKGLPPMAMEWATGAAALFAVLTALKMHSPGARWQSWVPGGLAVAVGMYNVPSFTLARTAGGLLSWYWRSHRRRDETPLIILASGFILGEGFLSIVNLLMESFGVPHL